MTNRKSKFLTVIFSCIPGAGQMFMGFMKLGVSLMGLFFLIFVAANLTGLGFLLYLAPVLWFYAFFDGINKCFMTDDKFSELEDRWLFPLEKIHMPENGLPSKYKLAGGICLVLLGLFMIWNNILPRYIIPLFPAALERVFDNVFYAMPQLIIAVAIIGIGIKLIIGRKKELNNDD